MRTEIDRDALEGFRTFCEKLGWTSEPTKGEWELLRMRHPDHPHPALIHFRKHEKLGLTLHGISARLWRRYEAS